MGLLQLASAALILAGAFFIVVGSLGILRMPDLFTRMHAVSVIDTLGAGLLILGLALAAGSSLVTLKLLFILALFFFTAPVVTHALAQAALHEGVQPLLADDPNEAQPAEQTRRRR
ncbi:MAG TPA: monovalent cation/H(+) antiporter subunit G [Propylenella sp.]